MLHLPWLPRCRAVSGISHIQCDAKDGNSLYGDVVLESFNMVYSDEDSILHQKYVRNTANKNKELIKLGFSATVVLV